MARLLRGVGIVGALCACIGCALPVSQSGGMTVRIVVRDATGTSIEVWGDHTGDSGAAVSSATQTVQPDLTLPVLP